MIHINQTLLVKFSLVHHTFELYHFNKLVQRSTHPWMWAMGPDTRVCMCTGPPQPHSLQLFGALTLTFSRGPPKPLTVRAAVPFRQGTKSSNSWEDCPPILYLPVGEPDAWKSTGTHTTPCTTPLEGSLGNLPISLRSRNSVLST